ncbi:MAG: FKBP-type peptidyl-prolyl cis-trans isomerase [Thermodesulfobacteriota bacterium]
MAPDAVLKENLELGESFLNANIAKDGVFSTTSGLQYEVMKDADGPKPGATDSVEVHYKGTFIDGAEFDSSYSRGMPASFPLDRVISGWTEGLQLMSVGASFRFFIPPDLAYGENAPPAIGPGRTLIFEVELLGIKG